MLIGPIALKLRTAETRFENRIFGAAELALALEYTLKVESAFVVQLAETASANTQDNAILQLITERFAVIVALDNGSSDKGKTGLIAYDKLFSARAEIFKAILGWQIPGAESLVEYAGGRVAGLNRAYLWYQFEFSVKTRIDDDDGVDVGADDLDMFDTIYAQWAIDGPQGKQFADMTDDFWADVLGKIYPPDMESIIDFTTNPDVDGGFGKGFGIKFDVFLG